MAYAAAAEEGKERFVVVDGKEGKQDFSIVFIGGGRIRIIFDSPDSLHYIAIKEGGALYLVEEKIK